MKNRVLIKNWGSLLIMAALLFQLAVFPEVTVSAAEGTVTTQGTLREAVKEGVASPVSPLENQKKRKLMPELIVPGKSMDHSNEPMRSPVLPKDLNGESLKNFNKLDTNDVTVQWHENLIPAIVVDGNYYWDGYEGVISYDIYVAPGAVLIITGDALLEANLYNYGLVIVSGTLEADYIYSNAYYDSLPSTYQNGDLALDESVSAVIWAYDFLSVYDIATLPIHIYSDNEVNQKGYLPLLEGAILPLFHLTLENVSVALNDNGSFTYNSYFVGNKPTLQFVLTDYFGQDFILEYELILPPAVEPSVKGLAGQTRFHTSQLISSAMYDYASTAILVRSDDYPDALAAGPLAYAWDAPILLTSTNELSDVTRQELIRLGVSKVVLLGGPLGISEKVKNELERDYTVERIAGDTRYTTAILAANRLKEYWGSPSTIIMTSGVNFPDALAAGSYAARNGYPLILTNGTNVLQHDLDFIQTNNVKKVILMGSTNVISSAVENVWKNRGLTVERIAGGTRADTAALMAKEYFSKSEQAIAANGWTFADALTAIPYAASLDAPILLVRKDYVELSVRNFLGNSYIHTITVVGGEQVVSSGVWDILLQSIQ